MNKFYFFLSFLLGMFLVFIGILTFVFSSYFMYAIVLFLGLLVMLDAISTLIRVVQGHKENIVQLIIKFIFGCLFLFLPRLPLSFVVIIFAIYVCVTGLSHFITYCYYRKEKVGGRIAFLVSAIVLLTIGITFILSPSVHAKEMTYIFGMYMIYIGIKYMGRAVKELLSENRKNTIKRRIRVSLPIFMVAFMPRILIEFVNEKLFVKDEDISYQGDSPLEVFIHVGKEGFGIIGHVDICYDGEVIAYGAYDEASTRLFGAIGDGVLFTADKGTYIRFCGQDDPTSHIFGYTIYLDDVQKQRIEKTIDDFKSGLIEWAPPCRQDSQAHDYASRLYKGTQASFYKFKKGQFKYYFVMTTNCVLLADRIIGKSGIDIVNMNGIITPGTYLSYFEEESKKENSRVLTKRIY